MMKKLFQAAVVITALLAGARAHAACSTPITAGMTGSQLQTAIHSCSSGSTAAFPAGIFGPVTSTITIPCGVSLSGPTVAYSQTPNQTATIDGASSFIGWGFQTTAGCSATQTIQYLAWDGAQPPATCAQSGGGNCGGGGFLNVVAGTTNLTVQYNWLHGVNAPNADRCASGYSGPIPYCATANSQADLIYLSGSFTSATTSNVVIQNNIFGSTTLSDCGGSYAYGAMTQTATEGNAGFCGGVGMHAPMVNVSVINNIFHFLEEPIKVFQNSGQCTNVSVNYNALSTWNRIGFETQCGGSTPGTVAPVTMNILYNELGLHLSNTQSNYDISAANGCYTNVNCVTKTDDNVDVVTVVGGGYDPGYEIWGASGTEANYNLFQGNGSGIQWSANGNFVFNNNNFNLAAGGNTNCQTATGGYWNTESSNPRPYSPSCSGNTFSSAGTGTYASVAPTISPASGAFSGSQAWTVNNAGTNRDTNTGEWCTTDGSTPVPGSGTAQYYAAGTGGTVTATTTVNCKGMWGAKNQPTSYPSGYGYVPSSLVSATYTLSGTPTAATPVFSPASESFTSAPISVSITDSTSGATIYYTTDGSAPTTSSTVYSGPLSISATTTVRAIATAPGYGNSAAGSATYTLTATLTLTSVTLATTGGVSSIAYQATNQLLATCHYSDGSTTWCNTADAHGNGVTMWASSSTAVVAISSSGLATGASVGWSNLTATVAGLSNTPLALAVTSQQTLNGCYLGTPGSANTMIVGQTLQFSAYCTYNAPGTTQNCSVADIYGDKVTSWSTSNTTAMTIQNIGSSTPGLASAVGAGTSNAVAQINGMAGSCSPWTVTVSNPSVTLTGISLSTTSGVTGIFVGQTNQIMARCLYSDGSSTTCNTTDSHGNVANSFASSNTAVATINATTGLAMGTAAGTTNITSHAGSFTSPNLPLAVSYVAPGTYVITTSGSVRFSGPVLF